MGFFLKMISKQVFELILYGLQFSNSMFQGLVTTCYFIEYITSKTSLFIQYFQTPQLKTPFNQYCKIPNWKFKRVVLPCCFSISLKNFIFCQVLNFDFSFIFVLNSTSQLQATWAGQYTTYTIVPRTQVHSACNMCVRASF